MWMGRAELCLSTLFPGLQCSLGSCEAVLGLWTQFKFVSSDRSSLPPASSPVSGSLALEDPSPGPMGLKASTLTTMYYPCVSSSSSLSHVRLFETPWTAARQVPLSIGFSRQESWSGLPSPSPGDLPDVGLELRSSASQVDSLPSEPRGKPLAVSRSKQCLAPVSPLHILDESRMHHGTGHSESTWKKTFVASLK